MYHLLTGQVPELMNVPALHEVRVGSSPALESIILRATQPDAAARYASAADMRTALQAALPLLDNAAAVPTGGAPTELRFATQVKLYPAETAAGPPPGPAQTAELPRNPVPPFIFGATAAVAVLALGFAAWLQWGGTRAPRPPQPRLGSAAAATTRHTPGPPWSAGRHDMSATASPLALSEQAVERASAQGRGRSQRVSERAPERLSERGPERHTAASSQGVARAPHSYAATAAPPRYAAERPPAPPPRPDAPAPPRYATARPHADAAVAAGFGGSGTSPWGTGRGTLPASFEAPRDQGGRRIYRNRSVGVSWVTPADLEPTYDAPQNSPNLYLDSRPRYYLHYFLTPEPSQHNIENYSRPLWLQQQFDLEVGPRQPVPGGEPQDMQFELRGNGQQGLLRLSVRQRGPYGWVVQQLCAFGDEQTWPSLRDAIEQSGWI
jgi:hypothetical protein